MPASGVINLYKPAGFSSAHWARKLRPILSERRVGHAGSLDPFADGVLLACAGQGTRLVERLMSLPKTYVTAFTLGATSATFDPETPAIAVPHARPPELPEILRGLHELTGEIDQVPPRHSAVKIAGWSAYQLARSGCDVPLSPRRVRIDAIELLNYDYPVLRLRIHCGRGTYIRALARDLGALCGCGAICTELTRTAVGPFRAEDGAELRGAPDPDVLAALLPVEVVRGLLAAHESPLNMYGQPNSAVSTSAKSAPPEADVLSRRTAATSPWSSAELPRTTAEGGRATQLHQRTAEGGRAT